MAFATNGMALSLSSLVPERSLQPLLLAYLSLRYDIKSFQEVTQTKPIFIILPTCTSAVLDPKLASGLLLLIVHTLSRVENNNEI